MRIQINEVSGGFLVVVLPENGEANRYFFQSGKSVLNFLNTVLKE